MKIQDIVFALLFLSVILFTASCSSNSNEERAEYTHHNATAPDTQTYLLRNTTVKVFWKENSINSKTGAAAVNENYLDTMSDPEKAALGYISLFTLRPKATEKNINFLKQWFRYDNKTLAKLSDYPESYSSKKEFEEIKFTVTSDTIKVLFKTKETLPGGVKSQTQEDTFRLNRNNLCLIEEKEIALNE